MSKTERTVPLGVADIEETDLHRRVLAHERILHVLIAQLAAGEPSIMPRLEAAFGGRRGSERREHDYVDTEAYAGEFLRRVERLIADLDPPQAEDTAAAKPAPEDHEASFQSYCTIEPVVILRVGYRRGIWEVTRDGNFYGHYQGRLSALDAAVAVAKSIVALSRRADVSLEDEPSAVDRKGHGPGVPGQMRTLHFRPPPVVTFAAP
ncbi:MAG TPA: hypothetical protein VE999_13030 [Gemmataceae bacterium]|nr:hypothetical protein [Gemmataceae bacterium]